MSRRLTAAAFEDAPGMDDWRILYSGSAALFRTGSFARSIEVVTAVAEVAGDAAPPPSFDVRDDVVVVRIPARDHRMHHDQLDLALRISARVRGLGVTSDPSAVQEIQVAIDATDPAAVGAFWAAALGYDVIDDDHLHNPNGFGPTVFIQDKGYRAPRNRLHVDVSVPRDQAEQRIAAILGAGGRMLGDTYAPEWWSLIDVEGNVVDLATWEGRDDEDASD